MKHLFQIYDRPPSGMPSLGNVKEKKNNKKNLKKIKLKPNRNG